MSVVCQHFQRASSLKLLVKFHLNFILTLAKGHKSVVCQHFQRASPMKLLGQFQLNFICSLLAKGGKKVYIFHPGHMTKMATMPTYGKNLKKSSSPEPIGQLP